ncbi:CBS domain-containing protein [Methylomarinum vadi]|uniref:CBS domain-containing protein n=1 Tax=Methylomarinum vadi TaxID=438855 RepID=UPI0004DF8FFC|nr:CBS domain-containing protein [Methylomarinum vadi]
MLAKITIADYMTKHVFTLKRETSVLEAIKSLLAHKVTCAPVVDEHGKLVGMFSEKDSMKVVLDCAYNQGMSGTVGEFMTSDIISVDADASIVDLAERFEDSTIRSFPVFRDNDLVGVVSRTDVLKALTSIK